MQMDGTRKFVDVAKEAMGKSENDKLYCLKDNWAQKGAWDTSDKKVVG